MATSRERGTELLKELSFWNKGPQAGLEGELATFGDIFTNLASLGNPLLSRRTRAKELARKSIIVNRPTADDGTQAEPFTVTDGTILLWDSKKGAQLALATAYGTFDNDDSFAVVGAAHAPTWNFWGIQRKYRTPEEFPFLVAESPMTASAHLSFRVGFLSDGRIGVTTGDKNRQETRAIAAADLLNPETRPAAITVVTDTILRAIKDKFSIPQ